VEVPDLRMLAGLLERFPQVEVEPLPRPLPGGEDVLARCRPGLLATVPVQFLDHLLRPGVQVHHPRLPVLRVQEEDTILVQPDLVTHDPP
jgi:hypothetical protein